MMAASLKTSLVTQLHDLQQMDTDALIERRYQRLMAYGISS